MKRLVTVTSAVLAVALFAGCESTQDADTAAAPGMLNESCPFSGNPVDTGAPTAEYAGGMVGFCCGGCAASWNGLGEADKAAKLASVRSGG